METPYYIYDGDIIATRCQDLTSAFADMNVSLHYAVKANDNPHILKLVHQAGIGACLVSSGEMKRAMNGGIQAQDMLMNGVGKTDRAIAFAIENNIGQLNIESLPEIDDIAKITRKLQKSVRVCVRVNPIIAAKTHTHTATGRKDDKFGILINDLGRAAAMIEAHKDVLIWSGLSCHIGSQIHGTEELAASYRLMSDLYNEWHNKIDTFDRLDLGGGFGVSYEGGSYAKPDDYAQLLRESVCLPVDTCIQLEPGRYISAEAGTLVTSILRVKDSDVYRFALVDAGMNDLVRPAMYGAYHPITLERNSKAPLRTTIVAGPICESSDIMGREYRLPEDIKAGDRLHIGYAGAYGYTMGSQYNARDRLPEYLKIGDNTQLIRCGFSAEEFDELTLENL